MSKREKRIPRNKNIEQKSSDVNADPEHEDKSDSLEIIHVRELCNICTKEITDDNYMHCKRCSLPFHAACCMSDETFQVMCDLSKTEIRFGSIGYYCEDCSKIKDSLEEYFENKLSKFEKMIEQKIDTIEVKIAKKNEFSIQI